MNSTLLQIVTDSSKVVTSKFKSEFIGDYWFWVAIAELLLIILLIAKFSKKHKKNFDTATEDLLNNSKKSNVDMDNLMNSINKSRELYKQLSTKCHPDRFPDEEQNKKANDLFQEITKNQRNYNRLLELKEIAQQELNITI